MKREPCAWVLNLDAEHEFERGVRYAPTEQVKRIVARERARLIGTLVQPRDVVVTESSPPNCATGLTGRAWSPTPRALALLARAGAEPSVAPSLEVLSRVNARSFAAVVREPLREGSFEKHTASDIDETLALLSRPAPQTAGGWLVRRSFGAAGRGRRRIAAGQPNEHELQWLAAGLRRGALVIESFVTVTREYTRSGWVAENGAVTISAPCFQATTPEGAWTRTECAERGAVTRTDDARLAAATLAAGTALARAGYFGPFGIDAFRHRSHSGRGMRATLNPLSEINARYTMDWMTAMGLSRPLAAEPGGVRTPFT